MASNWVYALSTARWSLWRRVNFFFDMSAWSRFSIGIKNGDRDVSLLKPYWSNQLV